MSQTGGGCRASNYIAFIRRALKKAGMEQIPVISINLSGLESNPGFKLTSSTGESSRLRRCIRRYPDEMCLPDASYMNWKKES